MHEGAWKKLPLGEARFNAIIGRYKTRAKECNREWLLTKEQVRIIMGQPCYYCGKPPSSGEGCSANQGTNGDFIYNGIDRVDNTRGYVENNTVACCRNCNIAKAALPIDVFLDMILKIYHNRKLGS